MQVSNRQVLIRPGEGRSLPGIIFKVHALDSGGPFSIVEHPYAPRVLIPPHVHAAVDQVSYVLEGTVGIRLGEEEFLAEKGAYVVKPRGIAHAHWNPTDQPARIMEVSTPGDFESFFEGMGEILGNPGPDTPQRLREWGARHQTTFLMELVPDLVTRHQVRLMGS